MTHLVGVLTTCEDISSQWDKFSVPELTWAVFPNEGPFPSTLQDTMAKIYSEWFLTSDYELAFPFLLRRWMNIKKIMRIVKFGFL